MKNPVLALGLFSLGMCLSMVIVYLLVEKMIEKNTVIRYVHRNSSDDVSPSDISALHEEVRKIQRETGDER